MASPKKKPEGSFKLQVPAGSANPSPPIGPAMGQRGINIMEFCKAFNDKTADMEKGMPIPTTVTFYKDKSFEIHVATPPASYMLLKAGKFKKGASKVGTEIIGSVTTKQLKEIAEFKMQDLNANDVTAAMKIIEGTARSMGIEVKG